MNIQEDYVSFEVAKLLKEKGFNERLLTYYLTAEDKKRGYFQIMAFTDDTIDNNHSVYCYLAPTLQMTMKWLREVHNLHIDVDPSEGDWNPTIIELDSWTCALKFGDKIPIQDSYEEACEAAIKYCLENLI